MTLTYLEAVTDRQNAILALHAALVSCDELHTVIRARPYKGKASEEKEILFRMMTTIRETMRLLSDEEPADESQTEGGQ